MDKPSENIALIESYAQWRSSALGQITDTLEERLLIELVGDPAGMEILDVGCGDGMFATRLAQMGATVTGVDSDSAMIRAASERAQTQGQMLRLFTGNAEALPFADASFDRVVAIAVLCFISDGERAVAEMSRVLRPGGRLIIGELGRWSLWAAIRRVHGWLGSSTWANAHFRSASQLRGLLARQGLDRIETRGAIYYPPWGVAAKIMRPVDPWFGRCTTLGAAFVASVGTKPDQAVKRNHGSGDARAWRSPQ